jgi:hypothetical protein
MGVNTVSKGRCGEIRLLNWSFYFDCIYTVVLASPIDFSLDDCVEYIQEDELVEVTPLSVRMCKNPKMLKKGRWEKFQLPLKLGTPIMSPKSDHQLKWYSAVNKNSYLQIASY